jgi:aldose 1-epimerase
MTDDLVLHSEWLRARVLPELGAGLAELSLLRAGGNEPVLRPAPPGATWFNDLACYMLAPWPNRIEGAAFRWRDRDIRLRADWPDGTAIHGLVKAAPWRVVECTSRRVRLTLSMPAREWPWPYECSAEYELDGRMFVNRLSLRHVGDTSLGPMPCGVGFHPFFAWPAGAEAAVRAPVEARYPLRRELPTGQPIEEDLTRSLRNGRIMDGTFIDDVFLGSPDGATVEWPDRGITARVRCSRNLGHTVVYSRGADDQGRLPESFCLEPVSMVNNGFRLASERWKGTGVVELWPGESRDAWWSLEVGDSKNETGPR